MNAPPPTPDNDFETYFAALKAFKEANGHCEVHTTYVTAEGLPLGRWLVEQRRLCKAPPPNTAYPTNWRDRMDVLGVIWSPLDYSIKMGFAKGMRALREFHDAHGHFNVPQGAKSQNPFDRFDLSNWLALQRRESLKPNYPGYQRAQLNELGIDLRDPKTDFDINLSALREFRVKFGHCDVPKDYITPNDLSLGKWLSAELELFKRNGYPEDRRAVFESLGVRWNLRQLEKQEKFDQFFAALQAFKSDHGHCFVPPSHVTAGDLPLGSWLEGRRNAKGNSPQEQRSRLEALGVDFRQLPKGDEWYFTALVKYKLQTGHCDVPEDFETTNKLALARAGLMPTLGLWLKTQRDYSRVLTRKGEEAEVILRERLGVLGAITTDEEFFAQLADYKAAHGDTCVPRNCGNLGAWLWARRTEAKMGLCSPRQLSRLVSAGAVAASDESILMRMNAKDGAAVPRHRFNKSGDLISVEAATSHLRGMFLAGLETKPETKHGQSLLIGVLRLRPVDLKQPNVNVEFTIWRQMHPTDASKGETSYFAITLMAHLNAADLQLPLDLRTTPSDRPAGSEGFKSANVSIYQRSKGRAGTRLAPVFIQAGENVSRLTPPLPEVIDGAPVYDKSWRDDIAKGLLDSIQAKLRSATQGNGEAEDDDEPPARDRLR